MGWFRRECRRSDCGLLIAHSTNYCCSSGYPNAALVCERRLSERSAKTLKLTKAAEATRGKVVPSWSDNADAGPRCQQSPHLQFCRSRHGKIAHKIRIGHRRYD